MKTAGLTPRTIAEDLGFTEGPVIRPDGEIVCVSIDRGLVYRTKNGTSSVLAATGGGPNGATESRDGTIYIAQQGGRTVERQTLAPGMTGGVQAIGRDGTVRWITKDPVSPNDLCFGPDGKLWVTDPTRNRTRDDGRLFRVDVATGECELLCTLPWYPNGIGFGIEDDALYVARASPPYAIVRFPIDGGRLGKPEVFADMGEYNPDGFLFDVEGNLTTTAKPDRLETYDRTGKLIDTYTFSDSINNPRNVALAAGRSMIVSASSMGGLIALDGWPVAGLPLHPFR